MAKYMFLLSGTDLDKGSGNAALAHQGVPRK
jgi:hypothetical protein